MSVEAHEQATDADAVVSWRRLAEQRDESLQEQERLIASLDATINRLEATQADLAAANHRLRAELTRLADDVAADRQNDAATRATLAYRAAVRLRNWFPVGSRRGTLARSAIRPFVHRDDRTETPQ